MLSNQERFEYAVNRLLTDEGGYSDLPNDPGGATNFGITQRELSSVHEVLNLPKSVAELTRAEAAYYYKIEWWERYDYNAINSLDIASKIFNMAVNLGPSPAHKLLQKAANCCGQRLTIDGILGSKTIEAVNEITLHLREDDLRLELLEEQTYFYKDLVLKNPKLKIFLKGWLARAAR